MGNYINDNGYMCYVRSGLSLSDTHGAGHAELHLREFEEVANAIIDKKLNAMTTAIENALPQKIAEYTHDVFERLVTSLVGALETDVRSEVRIALSNAGDVFYGDKAQKYISDNIMKAMLSELDKVRNIKIKL